MKKKHQQKHQEKITRTDNNFPVSELQEASFSDAKKSFPIKFQAVFIFLFAFLLYSQTLGYGYVLDDGLMITENKFTLKGFSGIKDILTHDQFTGLSGKETNSLYSGGRYRPMSQIFFAVEYALFGLNPFIGHLINLLLYGLLCVFIFNILIRIFQEIKNEFWFLSIPFVATILFAAHPLHTEVVANIKSSDEILCMLGGILVVYFSFLYYENKNMIFLFLSGLFFLFAVLSKESAITFLGVLPLVFFVCRKLKPKEYFLLVLPLILSTIIYLVIRYSVFGFITNSVKSTELFHNPFMYATTSERYATIMFTWGKYLQLLLFPHPLTHDYYSKQIAIINWDNIGAIVPALINAGLIILSGIRIFQKNMIAFGVLFYLFTFSVTSNLVFDLGLFMNERFMFTPSLGFTIVLACILIEQTRKFLQSKILITLLILIICGYSFKTISRNIAWKDGYTLFMTDVKTSTNSGRCNVIAGYVLIDKAKKEKDKSVQESIYREAEDYLIKGLNINPHNIGGWASLGEIDIYLEKYSQSIFAYKNVLSIQPMDQNAFSNLYYILSRFNALKKFDEAEKLCHFLIEHQPDNFEYRYALAEICRNTNRLDTSFIILENMVHSKPDNIDAYNRIAEYYGKYAGNPAKSVFYLTKAFELNPENPTTLENLGIVYGMLGNFDQSIKFFNLAIEKNPGKEQLYYNLAQTYRMKKDDKKANEILLKIKSTKH